MTREEFRAAIYATFGPRLEHVTPESMREFICKCYAQLAAPEHAEQGPTEVHTNGASSYEEIVIDFFRRMLECPADQAAMLLWLFAGEIYFADLGERYSERFKDLVPPESLGR